MPIFKGKICLVKRLKNLEVKERKSGKVNVNGGKNDIPLQSFSFTPEWLNFHLQKLLIGYPNSSTLRLTFR